MLFPGLGHLHKEGNGYSWAPVAFTDHWVESQEAMMTSRRQFLAKGFGTALVAAATGPIHAHELRSAQGQSRAGAPKSGGTTRKTTLRWEVFVTPSIPVVTSDLAPGEKERPWPPISSTLIYGERDAVLVDAFITVEQSRALANWVAASGKNLTTI
jgi:hypothetical protein